MRKYFILYFEEVYVIIVLDMMRRAMALQNLIIAVCFVTVLFNSMANGRPLHMGTMKRQTETGENTILQQITNESYHIFTNVRQTI